MSIKTIIGYAHGLSWKLAAQASKLGFVLLLLPRLPDGVFASYTFITSVALLAALALSFGSMDELPLLVRGRTRRKMALAALAGTPLTLTIATALASVATGSTVLIAAAVSGCSITYFFLSGLIRTTDPSQFELVSNAPSLIFLVAALLWPNLTVERLLWIFITANVTVMIFTMHMTGLLHRPSRQHFLASVSAMRRLLTRGNAKTASNVLMIADFRALITAPGLLLASKASDALSVALTIGEAFWQFAMVIVNRRYAQYCAGKHTMKDAVVSACLLGCAVACAALILMLAPIPIEIPRFDWRLIGWATLLFASFAALTEMRGFLWSRGMAGRAILWMQMIIAVLQAGIVVTAPPQMWLPLAALLVLPLTLCALAACWFAGRQ